MTWMLTLLLASSAPTPAALAREALVQAASAHGLRVEIVSTELRISSRCRAQSAVAPKTLAGSRHFVRLEGAGPSGSPCGGWAIVKAQFFERALVLTSEVAAGDVLDHLVVRRERPVSGTPRDAWKLTPGARARRALAAGTVLRSSDVRRPGPQVGTSVPVQIVIGALAVSGRGVVVPCREPRVDADVCVRMRRGARLAGQLKDGIVEVQP